MVTRLLQGHHRVRIMSSRPASPQSQGLRVYGDMASRIGLHEAVAGVDAIIHCATSLKDTQGVDVEGTRALVTSAKESGSPHLIYISIVGVEASDFFYYQKKYEAEQIVLQSGLPWSILRATQYHSFAQSIIESLLARSETEVRVPAGVHMQSINSGEVADRLVAIAELGPLYRVVEFGGPQVLTIEEMTQAYLQSRGRTAVVRAEPFSDPLFSALSSNSILTPNHATGLMTWKEF
ncbi:nucleotide-diphosphate-sugar epimerase [Dictyobacter formicarum]|uniref:Nucleotide-diphosphate-sugar epimerase n=1 Tax=Dictyobacter formicarum TaxID=2778368 RepID=A0ABQ3VMR3_9CHLR|nr:nucleotide-diphosphate-sugar epimerase [Dictyobacter formicarum]